MINNVVIVGLGAIGTIYALPLSQLHEIRLRIAMDGPRLLKYRENGLIFNDKPLDIEAFDPSAMPDKDPQQAADLIIIATKLSGYPNALNLIEPIVCQKTIILPLLNGIDAEKIAQTRYPLAHVLHGFFMGHTAVRVENHVRQDGRYKTYVGTLSPRFQNSLHDLTELFDKAGVKYSLPENIELYMWQKFIVNIGMNQATALLHCTYGHLQVNDKAHALMRGLMLEAAAIALACHVADHQTLLEMVDKACSLLQTLEPNDGSSMYQDVIAGRSTEIEMFGSRISQLGKLHNIPTPLNDAAVIILEALDLK